MDLLCEANKFGLVKDLDGKEVYVKGLVENEAGMNVSIVYTTDKSEIALWSDLDEVIELKELLDMAFDEPQNFDFLFVQDSEE